MTKVLDLTGLTYFKTKQDTANTSKFVQKTGDSITGNLSVSGTITGNVTGNVTGDLTGTASKATNDVDGNAIKTTYAKADVVVEQSKRLTNLEEFSVNKLLTYSFDTTTAYKKTVPARSSSYAPLMAWGGRSIVWNQLATTTKSTTTVNGITFTNNGDGSWTLNGTSTAEAMLALLPTASMKKSVAGHKYLVRGCQTGGSNDTYFLYLSSSPSASDFGSGAIVTATASDNLALLLYVRSGVTVTNAKITPQLHDLTLMFGSGNEPATVDAFKAIFTSDSYSYTSSAEVLSAQLQSVYSIGRNILKSSGRTTESATGGIVNRTFNESKVILGLSAANYGMPAQISSASLTDTSITFTTDSSNYGCGYFVKVNPNTTYYATYTSADTSMRCSLLCYASDGSFISVIDVAKTTGTTPDGTSFGILLFRPSNTGSSTISNICLNKSDGQNGTYSAYMESTFSIPSAVKALTGYGWSAGSVYNEVNIAEGKYVQRVTKMSVTGAVGDEITLTNAKSGTSYLCALGDIGTVSGTTLTLTVAVTSVDVYYELATYVETDVSSYLSDTYLRVEAGGTLEFKNQLTNMLIPISSTEKFEIRTADAS